MPTASEWRPFGLQGTVVRSLAASPDLLCAGTQGNGVHCLDLLAPSPGWVPNGLAGTVVFWLWIDPLTPDIRFVAVDSPFGTPTLHRTLDGGETWEALTGYPSPRPPRVFAVQGVPGSPTVFTAGGEIWRSDDLGGSWSLLWNGGGLDSLEVAPTDPDTLWAGGETVIFMGFTLQSRDGGLTWSTVWDSSHIGDNQTADISAHPRIDGLALTGHEGFILRTEDHGASFTEVLTTPARFFLDWDGGNPQRAYGAGSPNSPQGHAYVSRDLGLTWTEVTGTLASLTVFRLEADDRRLGVAYAATDDGVHRFYGGGLPSCLDLRDGLDELRLWPGVCPPGLSPGAALRGDVVVVDPSAFAATPTHLDLGESECLLQDADIDLATIDVPEPTAGGILAILARRANGDDYGSGSGGLARVPSLGDCP